MKKANYRPEIDGLRAIAVMSVIVFHSGASQLPGGFVGVDIFYVISGYLITKIIVLSLQSNTFTFSGFYVRRLKRLLPAALFVVVTSVLLGVFFLTPDKFIELSKSAIFSNLFIANIWFNNNSGYFDLSTQISPLLHMWSLSVEEQFYLIFPLVLFSSYRVSGIKGVKLTILLITVFSLMLSISLSSKFPNYSFYMLPTRAWELGIGSLVAFLPLNTSRNSTYTTSMSAVGAVLILYGIFTISHNDIYPGYLALIPTLGAGLLIYSLVNDNNIVSKLITLRPLLFLGKISYSAYLWHWPIIVYYRIYIYEREFYSYETLLLIIVSIFTGYLSWRYVEERYRYRKYSYKTVFSLSLCATILAISIPGSVYFNHGFPERVSDSVASITDQNLMWKWECTERISIFPDFNETYCVVGLPWEESKNKGVVWGDSHSQHWAQILHQEALYQGASLVIAPEKCPPYLDSKYVKSYYPKFPTFTEDCTRRNNQALSWLKKNPDISVVIMASAWSGHIRMLYTTETPINKSSLPLHQKSAIVGRDLSEEAFRILLFQLPEKSILLLGDIPRPNRILNECAGLRSSMLMRENCDSTLYNFLSSKQVISWHRSSDEVLRTMSEEFENVETLIPGDFLCDGSHCLTYINKEFIYKDTNHIRRNLSNKTAGILSETIGLHDRFQVLWKN